MRTQSVTEARIPTGDNTTLAPSARLTLPPWGYLGVHESAHQKGNTHAVPRSRAICRSSLTPKDASVAARPTLRPASPVQRAFASGPWIRAATAPDLLRLAELALGERVEKGAEDGDGGANNAKAGDGGLEGDDGGDDDDDALDGVADGVGDWVDAAEGEEGHLVVCGAQCRFSGRDLRVSKAQCRFRDGQGGYSRGGSSG